MTVNEMGVVMRGIAPAIKEYAADVFDGFRESQVALSARLKALEERPMPLAGADGGKGDRGPEGRPGKDVDPAVVDALKAKIEALQAEVNGLKSMPATLELVKEEPPDFEAMVKVAVAEVMAQVVMPKDGTSVSIDDVAPLLVSEVTKAVAAIPPAKDGAPGQSVEMSDVEALVAKAVADIPRPKDGHSVSVKDVQPLIAEEVARAVALIPIPKDGDSVMDALIARDGHLILTLSDGTTKDVGPVVGRDVDMQTVELLVAAEVARIPRPKDGADGFGFDDFEEVFDGERTYTRRYTQGDRVKEFTFKVSYVLDRGVYRSDTQYEKGDGATWGGSFWIAQEDTRAKPGDPGPESRAWRLAVKKGADGKEGKPGLNGKDGKVVEVAHK